jgi:hypothetical protein
MKFERLTDPGPKGGKAAFAVGKTPEQLGVAFALSRIRIELPPGVNDLGEALRHRVHRLLCCLSYFISIYKASFLESLRIVFYLKF